MMPAPIDGYYSAADDQDLRRYLAVLPSPATIAATLPHDLQEALRAAWRTTDGWRVATPHHARALRPHGLCDIAKPLLTVLGAQVRAVIMGQG